MALTLVGAVLLLDGCASSVPAKQNDVCAVFDQKRGWFKAARKAEKRWGIPVPVGMAFVHRESSYVSDAKPPRKRLLGFVPWTRLSSAYGYAQATDEAWEDYAKETRRWFIDRDDFDDAMDFIGWYNDRSARKLGIAKHDAYHLYLAYYTGPSGYRNGVWKRSESIKGYARKVANQAGRYEAQMRRCPRG